METSASMELSGWGGSPRHRCAVFRPEKRQGLANILKTGDQATYIARGLGRSYGDPAVNPDAGVIDCTRLNRMLSFDAETGELECEGGVSFAEILEVFVPRGWFLPVTPGTKFVTVGGAIANDVHGKNHHRDGTFGNFVIDFDLLTPAGETLRCSREENADVFWATLGGIGLTGLIVRARIRLQRIETAYMIVDQRRARNLDEILQSIFDTQDQYQYSVAWVDCLARGQRLGRSVLLNGRHADAPDLPAGYGDPLRPPAKRPKSIPFAMPGFMLNRFSVAAFNECIYRAHPTRNGRIVDYDSYFYPLDSIHHWNRFYGKRGFAQYQATFPFEGRAGLVAMLERLSQSRRASFLAVLKCFGPANQGLLSHPIEGYTLTLDLPMSNGLVPFLHELDTLLLTHGGRLYLAKDSCARAETIAAMYPRLDEFRAIRKRLDPGTKLTSSMSRRLAI